jgi:hypothetical protein
MLMLSTSRSQFLPEFPTCLCIMITAGFLGQWERPTGSFLMRVTGKCSLGSWLILLWFVYPS